jgi:transcriptional regulator with XRE-family HTH domain
MHSQVKVMQNNIKEKIKELRKDRNLTLEQLANIVGCSKSYISQLENGVATPSISMLGKLSKGLNTNMTNLILSVEENGDQSTARVEAPKSTRTSDYYMRKNRRRTFNYPDGKTLSQFLTTAVYQKTMQPIYTTIEPGGESNGDDMIIHPKNSEEFVWVLKGKVEFEINGEILIIEEGDTLYFDGSIPHRWKNTTQQLAEALFVWTPAVW